MVCCLDGLAKCVFTIFERRPLPETWSKNILLTFVIPMNIFFLFGSLLSEWLLFGFCLEKFRNPSIDDDNKKKISYGFYVAYIVCLSIVSVLFIFHICANLITCWFKKWNPPLSMWLEIITFLLANVALPVFICLMFMLTPICVDLKFCQWQLFLFSMFNVLATIWSSFKLMYMGLCCCCCATVCTTSWPLYTKVRRIKRGDNLMTNVLRWMPVDSESSTWAQAGKWCALSMWTFPLTIVGLTAAICLIALISMNHNFLYPCSK